MESRGEGRWEDGERRRERGERRDESGEGSRFGEPTYPGTTYTEE
jgi:hypothetical protein